MLAERQNNLNMNGLNQMMRGVKKIQIKREKNVFNFLNSFNYSKYILNSIITILNVRGGCSKNFAKNYFCILNLAWKRFVIVSYFVFHYEAKDDVVKGKLWYYGAYFSANFLSYLDWKQNILHRHHSDQRLKNLPATKTNV